MPFLPFVLEDVGNKAAVFPLQLLGFDVDFVNSVHFSNHTGYENGLTGDVLQGDQLRDILHGLNNNSLLEDVGYLLTGYIGSTSFLKAVLEVVDKLRSSADGVRYICDPVLGDDGKFYVPPELVQVYKESLIPLADVVTPNQFEVEQLTGISVTTMEDARKACKVLHSMGPSIVFITSVIFEKDSASTIDASTTAEITIIGSRRWSQREGAKDNKSDPKRIDIDGDEVWRIDCPLLPGSYTGTGDLTAALLCGHLAGNGFDKDLSIPMEKVVNTMFVVIQRTKSFSGVSAKSKELKLIQSKYDIENPPATYQAKCATKVEA